MNERELLEAKTKEELIDELLERRQEIQNLETELAGTNEAEEITDAQADKYANLLAEADRAITQMRVRADPDEYDDDVRLFIAEAIKRHELRQTAKS